ncbi:hypothetical protein [Cellulosimicrobium cellulans]|uniref:hypothetical protein n=1 Tax=Cellulosimicrobium cellulans TaxID=1710 RepID=UPI00130E83F3|nr:hypothetical protein [Cellulosimicrobium cellulans]
MAGVLMLMASGACTPDEDGRRVEGGESADSGVGEPTGRRDSYLGLFPEFEAAVFAGAGDETVELPGGAWAGLVFAEFAGSGAVSVWETDASGVPISTLVNRHGPYRGTLAYGLDGLTNASALTVRAPAEWTIRILPVTSAAELPPEGSGDGVFRNLAFDGKVPVTYPGDEVFTMTAFPDFAWPELKIYSIPHLDVSEVVPGSTASSQISLSQYDRLVVVRSTGSWTIG